MAVPNMPLETTIPVGYTPHNSLHVNANEAVNYLGNDSHAVNLVFASPSAAPGAADFRALVYSDIAAALLAATSVEIGGTKASSDFAAFAQTFTDPAASMNAVSVYGTEVQTAASANRVIGLNVVATLNNATFNNTNANGINAFAAQVNVTGTAGTVTSALAGSISAGASAGATVTKMTGYRIFAFTSTGGSTIASVIGLEVRDQTAGATNNVNLWLGSSGAPSPVGQWNLYVQSSKDSAFAGNVRFGGLTTPAAAVDVTGTARVDVLRIDQTPVAATPTPTHTFTIDLNGTTYRVPCVV